MLYCTSDKYFLNITFAKYKLYKSESIRADCSQLTEDKLGFFAELPQKPLSGRGGVLELHTAKIH